MKTITLKADTAFDDALTELALQQQTTKSAVIRDAVEHYRSWLEREQLRQKVYKASLRTREHHAGIVASMDQANSDGL